MQVFQLAVPKKGWSYTTEVRVWRHGLKFTPDGRYLYVDANVPNLLDTTGTNAPGVLPQRLVGFAREGTVAVSVADSYSGTITLTNLDTKQQTTHQQKGRIV